MLNRFFHRGSGNFPLFGQTRTSIDNMRCQAIDQIANQVVQFWDAVPCS